MNIKSYKIVGVMSILLLIMCAGLPATAQETLETEIKIATQDGRQVVSIRKDNHYNDGTITIAGFEINFGTKGGDEMCDTINKFRHIQWHGRKRNMGLLGFAEFGFNGLSSPDYSIYPEDHGDFLDLKNARSTYVALNIMRASSFNRARTLGFATGLCITWRDYVFDNDITLVREGGVVQPLTIDSKYKKSKLSTFSLTVPVLLEATVREKFFIAAGGYVDLVVGSHTKYKKPKHKDKGFSAVNTFQAGVTAKIGFRDLYIFGNYGLTTLFKNGKGPGTHPFTIGIGTDF